MMDLMEEIEKLCTEEPKTKRTKERKDWLKTVNALILDYNNRAGTKIYNLKK